MKTPFALITACFLLTACAVETPPTEVRSTNPVPSATSAPTATTEPSATLQPADPIAIGAETASDGCTVVDLNPEAWQPLFTAYNSGSDPFFHVHTQEAAGTFFFSMELYTVYGSGWTGQLGTFSPSCTANGLCVYLVPDASHAYLATEGELEIVSLSQVDGVFTLPLEIQLRDITLQPAPGSSSTGCYHIESLSIELE